MNLNAGPEPGPALPGPATPSHGRPTRKDSGPGLAGGATSPERTQAGGPRAQLYPSRVVRPGGRRPSESLSVTTNLKDSESEATRKIHPALPGAGSAAGPGLTRSIGHRAAVTSLFLGRFRVRHCALNHDEPTVTRGSDYGVRTGRRAAERITLMMPAGGNPAVTSHSLAIITKL